MRTILTITRAELLLWFRSRLALSTLLIFALLLIATSVVTALRMTNERHQRTEQQIVAEEFFRSQPDRHPHRMVHYGHYVFRVPPPLSMVDPGIDSVTGQSMFLEGHRQNTAMFADASGSADLGGFENLTVALVYQLFLPLLLIAIGHSLIIREREENTLALLLAQGVTGIELYAAKWMALAGVSVVLLLPLGIMCAVAFNQGAALLASIGVVVLYALYLLIWCSLILLISSRVASRGLALGLLALFWLAAALIVPRISVDSAKSVVFAPSKLQFDLHMQAELRELGDSHNADSSAFQQLRAELLAQYDVERVEDLPVNFRGIVAEVGEANWSEAMDKHAEERMALEMAQARFAASFGWLSPVVAVSTASRGLSGTDLSTHHRFLREAEAVRFDYVQGLNRAHAERLPYSVDINRSVDEESSQRARISAENWNVLDEFAFQPATAAERLVVASASIAILIIWLLVLLVGGILAARKILP